MRTVLTVAAAFAVLCVGATSDALAQSLIGSTVTADYLFPDVDTIYQDPITGTIATSAIVVQSSNPDLVCEPFGAGICTAFPYAAQFDIDATSITFSEGTDGDAGYEGALFNGIRFSGLDFGPGFFLAGFNLHTNLAGLTSSDVSFTPTSIQFNAESLDFSAAPYYVTLDLYVGSVPEPATLLLLGSGLVGLGLLRRRAR